MTDDIRYDDDPRCPVCGNLDCGPFCDNAPIEPKPEHVRQLEASLLTSLVAFTVLTAKLNVEGRAAKLSADLCHEWASVAADLIKSEGQPEERAWAMGEARRLLDVFVDPLGVHEEPLRPRAVVTPQDFAAEIDRRISDYKKQADDFFTLAVRNARQEFRR